MSAGAILFSHYYRNYTASRSKRNYLDDVTCPKAIMFGIIWWIGGSTMGIEPKGIGPQYRPSKLGVGTPQKCTCRLEPCSIEDTSRMLP